MEMQGTFLAAARVVSGVEFKINWHAEIDLDCPDKLIANFNVENPKAGWKLDAYGEMKTGITLETGFIISVMVVRHMIKPFDVLYYICLTFCMNIHVYISFVTVTKYPVTTFLFRHLV